MVCYKTFLIVLQLYAGLVVLTALGCCCPICLRIFSISVLSFLAFASIHRLTFSVQTKTFEILTSPERKFN